MSNNFNMSFDATTRQQFADILADYGLTVPQAFKLFANQVIKTGVVPLSFDWKNSQVKCVPSSLDFDIKEINHEKNPITMQAIREFKQGDVSRYQSFNDFLKEIENETN